MTALHGPAFSASLLFLKHIDSIPTSLHACYSLCREFSSTAKSLSRS